MTDAVFKTEDDVFKSFKITGHSGYAESGADIVCAAVSAMAGLVIHIAVDLYNDGGKIVQDEDSARLEFYPLKEESYILVKGLYDNIRSLSEEFPGHVSAKIIRKRAGTPKKDRQI